MVVDTSAILAVLFDEPRAEWVIGRLEEQPRLKMSVVNLAEVLIVLRDRFPKRAAGMERKLEAVSIEYFAPTPAIARAAATARLRYPLSLGDCFAYALAVAEDDLLLTLDSDFRKTDARIVLPS